MGCGKSKVEDPQKLKEAEERIAAEKAAQEARLAREKEEEERKEKDRIRLQEEAAKAAEEQRKREEAEAEAAKQRAKEAEAAARAAEEERRRKLPVKCAIIGPPGSTKGKLCELLVSELACKHVSTGEATRHAVQSNTAAGQKAQEARKQGQQLTDELTLDIIAEHLKDNDVNNAGWILDGFPRTTDQVSALRDRGVEVNKLLVVGISNDELVKRAVGRRMDLETHTLYHLEGLGFPKPPEDPAIVARLMQRKDDQEDRVRARLDQYREQNHDIVPSFTQVHTIDGTAEPQDCIKDIIEFLRS